MTTPRTALAACRAVLEHGTLIRHKVSESGVWGTFWRVEAAKIYGFKVLRGKNPKAGVKRSMGMLEIRGGRLFSSQTVNQAIESGFARRDGDRVVKV